MNIVLTDYETIDHDPRFFQRFEAYGPLTLYDTTSDDEAAPRLRDAEAVLCNKTNLTADVLKQCPRLRYIGLFATGYNNIDIQQASAQGITVCNAGRYSTQAVAQHTFALMLECFGCISTYRRFTESGSWQKCRVFSPILCTTHELYGRTLGIVGYGNIGKAVARIGRAFGMRLLVHTRTPGADPSVTYVSLPRLLEESDVISLHCPLTDQNQRMLGREQFRQCRRRPLLINTARGGLIDEAALAEALREGWLSGAALDTLTKEPMAKDCPLIGAPNLLLTPHVAWAARETIDRLVGIVEDNLSAFLSGRPQNQVG